MKEFILVTEIIDEFDEESKNLYREIKNFLQCNGVQKVKVFQHYHIQVEDEKNFAAIKTLFNQNDTILYEDLRALKNYETAFRVQFHEGQYNQREDMLNQLAEFSLGIACTIRHTKIVSLSGLSDSEIIKLKSYYINSVEMKEIPLDAGFAVLSDSTLEELEPVKGFISFDKNDLQKLLPLFSMDMDDLLLCQDYFKKENRNPNMSELKMIDTYWSDHCRHTTFLTELSSIQIHEGTYKKLFESCLQQYLADKKKVSAHKSVCLMDIATINMKKKRAEGTLDEVEVSDEVNAASVFIDITVNNKPEKWILYFKNETHNHPTEIEPYGGASTCIGGGIRDPLSGRSIVYQAMRISGAADPRTPYEQTRKNKLSQRKICLTALQGNSDYSNQIGMTAGYAREVYHPGYEAKRLELGALVAAAPRENVVRENPVEGDLVLLLGGKTGRDGIGAAVGSSKEQTAQSLQKAGAEVQKGNPLIERKIIRLFRRSDASKLIKKCNDFGAGGVAVAVGELADGLDIYLDKVPVKYGGMHGGEIALSESQERMAVVIAQKDLETFLSLAAEEDVPATLIAKVRSHNSIKMYYHDALIIDLKRELLNSNGAKKTTAAVITQPEACNYFSCNKNTLPVKAAILQCLSDISSCSQQAMAEQFDSTLGRGTVLMPFGGIHQRTPQLGMAAKLPVPQGKTDTCSLMACGYDPELSSQSPFHGGYYAVLDSIARIVAMGGEYQKIHFSFQEYFERLGSSEEWGKPLAALLGAYKAMRDFDLASIGGKDSMSGSFEDLSVPPGLFSFAVALGSVSTVVSRELKAHDSVVVLLPVYFTDDKIADVEKLKENFSLVQQLAQNGKIRSSSVLTSSGLIHAVLEMSFGNEIGFEVLTECEKLFDFSYGSILLELAESEYEQLLANRDYQLVAKTLQEPIVKIANETISLSECILAYTKTLSSVYTPSEEIPSQKITAVQNKVIAQTKTLSKNKKVLIPIVPGSFGEYDLQDAFMLEGARVSSFVFKTNSADEYAQSVKDFASLLQDTDILALPNGAIMADVPDAQGKLYALILSEPLISAAIEKLLERNGFIFGVGAGFAGLIQSGLIEYGKVTGKSSISLQRNNNDKYICRIRKIQFVNNNSPWLANTETKEFSTVFSTRFGKLAFKNGMDKFVQSGQICTQFTTVFGEDENGIESMCSPCGKIFGCIGSPERLTEDIAKNVPRAMDVPYIKNICKA